MEISIDMEILDEAYEVVMKDSFAQYLLAHTTNFETCLFIKPSFSSLDKILAVLDLLIITWFEISSCDIWEIRFKHNKKALSHALICNGSNFSVRYLIVLFAITLIFLNIVHLIISCIRN